MATRETLIACIDWNRRALDHAWRERHNPNREKALEACRAAQRFGNNVAALEEQLLGLAALEKQLFGLQGGQNGNV